MGATDSAPVVGFRGHGLLLRHYFYTHGEGL